METRVIHNLCFRWMILFNVGPMYEAQLQAAVMSWKIRYTK